MAKLNEAELNRSEAKKDETKRGVLFAYRSLLAEGSLRRDASQLLAAEKLQSLHNALLHYTPQGAESGGWRERFGLRSRRQGLSPMGLYLYGSAGVGKSMLMDLFFSEVVFSPKRRVHFHEFMLEVHSLLKDLRDCGDTADVIFRAAEVISERSYLLCFDEFHVGNITDAMILGRLFEGLFARGVVIVATSNISPDDLYSGGLQRDRFLPFIDLLKVRFDVLHMCGGEDYRLRHLEHLSLYFDCASEEGRHLFDAAFLSLTGRERGVSCELSVGGRQLVVSEHVGRVCRFDFGDLCGRALGSGDYLVLSEHFRVIFLRGVPVFTDELRNELKRFILLVDILYERGVILCMSAFGDLESLCAGREHAFEFARTYSRLQEMRSAAYSASLLETMGSV